MLPLPADISQQPDEPQLEPRAPETDEAAEKRAQAAHLRHQMRAPLNRIVSCCEAVLEGADAGEICLPTETQVDFEKILECAHTLLRLTEDIFAAARLESDGEVDVEAAARRAQLELRTALRTAFSTLIGLCATQRLDAEMSEEMDKIRRAAASVGKIIDGIVVPAARG